MLDHHACIDALITRTGDQLPPLRRLRVFEAAFNTIWRRARITLGEVTLTAIFNRVLHNATEQFPELSALKVASDGINCRELERRLDGLERPALAEGLRYVLVELLTVIGSLTADILTPALHEALSTVTEAEGCQREDGENLRERTHDT